MADFVPGGIDSGTIDRPLAGIAETAHPVGA